MKQAITPKQLEQLSEGGKTTLWKWFLRDLLKDDTLVRVYIPTEQVKGHPGIFWGLSSNEQEFQYPEPYIGKINCHQGRVYPLLTIGQLFVLIQERGNTPSVSLSTLLRFLPMKHVTLTNLCDALWEEVRCLLDS